ncbi:MAG: hypothetical protein QGD94_10305, partial [Planctomycetia bacterium]|nr:hypothetical protein [Planctomycetia bacterium]
MIRRFIGLAAALLVSAVLLPAAEVAGAQKIRGLKYIKESKNGLGSREVADIVFDGRRTWFATRKGLYLKEGSKWRRFTHIDGLPTVNLVTIANDGNTLWIGGLGGLSKLDKKSGKIERIHLPLATSTMKAEWVKSTQDQFDQLVLSVAVDGDDIWVGTHTGAGIYNKKTGKVKEMRYWGDWRGDDYLDIVITRDKVYAACTYVFAVMDKKTGDWEARPICLTEHNFIMGPHSISVGKNYLWLPSRVGLVRYDKKTKKLGVYIFRGMNPFFSKESYCPWVSLSKALIGKGHNDIVTKRMGELLPEGVKSQMEKYAKETEAFVKKDPYSTPPAPAKAILDALNAIVANAKFATAEMAEPWRQKAKGEKNLPKKVLNRYQTKTLKKIKSGKASKIEIAHFNRQVMNRNSTNRGLFGPYRSPEEGTLMPRRQYGGKDVSTSKLPSESEVPILGRTMSDSWCWSAVEIGNEVWVGTNNGLTVMNIRTEKARIYTSKN